MADVKVKLLRPLNGQAIGSEAHYSKADAERLEASGAVKIVGKAEPAPENKALSAAPENKAATFDHDGDGKPGGAPKGGNRKRGR